MTDLTTKAVLYTASLEGMVQEMYLDSKKIPTWALGVTDASGHKVGRYKDNPQSLQWCCDVSVWLMRQKYLPAVLSAFSGFNLNEAQLAAALSFHWNTGKIGSTSWVSMVKAGQMAKAEEFLQTHYTNDTTDDGINNGPLTKRRFSEAELFFNGVWPSLLVPIFPVNKPSYTPSINRGKLTDLSSYVAEALKK